MSTKRLVRKEDDISANWEDLGARAIPGRPTLEQLKAVSRAGKVPNTPLPSGWTWKIDGQTGKIYFLNHLRRQSAWEDPRPLPHMWSVKRDASTQRAYFLDHQTKTTTWEDPRPFPPSERDVESVLDAKIADKPKGATMEGPRAAWVDQMVQMGFDREKAIRGCKIEKNKLFVCLYFWFVCMCVVVLFFSCFFFVVAFCFVFCCWFFVVVCFCVGFVVFVKLSNS